MTVLVTGGSGFIGAAVVRRLGDVAVAGVRPSSGAGRLSGWSGRRVALDVIDLVGLRDAVLDTTPEAIVHTAVVRDEADAAMLGAAVAGVEALCRAAGEAGVAHVVVFGSAAEYGRAQTPMREDGPSLPTTTHGVAKAAEVAEAHRWAATTDGPSVTVLRPFHVTGRGEPLAKLVPRALVAAGGGPALPMVAGGVVRDLVHVDDVVAAVVAALDKPVTDGLPVNLCSGTAVNAMQVVAALERASGTNVPVAGVHPRSPYDEERRLGDPERARSLWSWEAAGLDEVAARCVRDWPWSGS